MKLKVGGEGGGEFLTQPEGMIQAVLCDVVDEGEKETGFGVKPKLSLRFLSGQLITREDFINQGKELREEAVGEPFLYTAWFTVSLHPKAALYKALEAWGAPLPAEGEEFELDDLIGRNALLNVTLQEREGKPPFAKVVTVNPLPQGMQTIVVSPNYTRVKDRQAEAGSFNYGANAEPAQAGPPPGAE